MVPRINYQELNFQRFIDVPRCDCQIGTARDNQNRVHIFLIVNHTGPVYRRNGLKDNYEQLEGLDSELIRDLVKRSQAPRYTTRNQPVLN